MLIIQNLGEGYVVTSVTGLTAKQEGAFVAQLAAAKETTVGSFAVEKKTDLARLVASEVSGTDRAEPPA